jgi:hypothetical protein
MNYPYLFNINIALFIYFCEGNRILNVDSAYVEFIGYNLQDTQRRLVGNCCITYVMLRNFRYLSAYQIPPKKLTSTADSSSP